MDKDLTLLTAGRPPESTETSSTLFDVFQGQRAASCAESPLSRAIGFCNETTADGGLSRSRVGDVVRRVGERDGI